MKCLICFTKIGYNGICYECNLPPEERKKIREERERKAILSYKKRKKHAK